MKQHEIGMNLVHRKAWEKAGEIRCQDIDKHKTTFLMSNAVNF